MKSSFDHALIDAGVRFEFSKTWCENLAWMGYSVLWIDLCQALVEALVSSAVKRL